MSSQPTRTADASAWTPDANAEPTCDGCGQHVDANMSRVFGREDGTLERCLGCATIRELTSGAGAGKDVPAARSTFPSRGGGQRGGQL